MNLFLSPVEERIVNSLKEAAAIHERDGSDPNGAVKTAALNNGLNAEMTNRLVEAFNITFIRRHIKTAEEKDSGIPLADKAEVFKMLFKDEPLPGQKFTKTASLEENSGPVWSSGPKTRKVAEAPKETGTWFAGPSSIPARIASVIDTDDRARSNIRGRKEAALDEAVAAGTSLAEKFSSSYYRGQFKGFQSEALSAYGEEALPVLESIRKSAGIQDSDCLRDPGAHAGKFLSKLQYPQEVALVGRISKATRKYAEALVDEKAMEETMNRRKETLEKFTSGNRKSAAAGDPSFLAGLMSSEYKPSSFSGIQNDVLVASDMVDSPSAMDINRAQIAELTKDYGAAATNSFRKDRGIPDLNADASSDARAFVQSSVLSDLMSHDEIISAADPKEVKEAFATLARLSPEAASNPSVARSIIRSTLAGDGALDPFTADQIVTLQEKVMKTRGQLRPTQQ